MNATWPKKPSKDVAAAPARRGGPLQFFQEVRREASKVTWPTWKETYLTTIMVFIMVGVTMVFFCGGRLHRSASALNFVLGV